MQIILGSGGTIATPLAEILSAYTDHVICASRKPHELPASSTTRYEHRSVDLLDGQAVMKAVAGAKIVYVTVGIVYDVRIWRKEWPVIIDNIISAAARAGARVAFFDSMYTISEEAYGNMTELSPTAPTSEKGKVRLQIIDKLWAAHQAGKIKVTVARSADFYGPGATNSLLHALVIDKLVAGDTPQWLGGPDLSHSFTYTLDAARHFALLANDDRAYGDTWHLPTAPNPWTAREWVARASQAFGRPDKLQLLPTWLFWLLARFNRQLWEVYDIRAQTALNYVFNSDKFESVFDVEPTSYARGLEELVAYKSASIPPNPAATR